MEKIVHWRFQLQKVGKLQNLAYDREVGVLDSRPELMVQRFPLVVQLDESSVVVLEAAVVGQDEGVELVNEPIN